MAPGTKMTRRSSSARSTRSRSGSASERKLAPNNPSPYEQYPAPHYLATEDKRDGERPPSCDRASRKPRSAHSTQSRPQSTNNRSHNANKQQHSQQNNNNKSHKSSNDNSNVTKEPKPNSARSNKSEASPSARTASAASSKRSAYTISNDKTTSRKTSIVESTTSGSHGSEKRSGCHHTSPQPSNDGKLKKREKIAIKSVSKSVENKLTFHINDGQRERFFSPSGVYYTTYKMFKYDLRYRLLEEEKERQNNKKRADQHCTTGGGHIKPCWVHNSQQMTPKSTADRISKYANEIFDSLPIPKLTVIHRYRPHNNSMNSDPQTGHVHNYSRHEGAVLHSHTYIDYYLKQGLHCGNAGKGDRQQQMPKKKGGEDNAEMKKMNIDGYKEKETRKTDTNSRSDKKLRDKPQEKDGDHCEKQPSRVSSPASTCGHSINESEYSDHFESEGTDNRSANQKSKSSNSLSDHHESMTSLKSMISHASSTNTASASITSRNQAERDGQHHDIDSRSNCSYSNDFEPEEEINKPNGLVEADSMSVHTYRSVEHAVDRIDQRRKSYTSDRAGSDNEDRAGTEMEY